MRRTALDEKLRRFDLFCLFNSCGAGGYCDPPTIYYLLLGLDEIGLDEKPPPTLSPHWLLYLNGTNYGVVISYHHPYFYCTNSSWRRFQPATVAWANKIAAFSGDDWNTFAQHIGWCHPFPQTLAFLTATAWRLGGSKKVEIGKEAIAPQRIEGEEEIVEGITAVSILKKSKQGIYLTTTTKDYLPRDLRKTLTFLKFVDENHYELAKWLGHVILLTTDDLAYQSPGLKSRSKNKTGKSLGENV
jgi:hypothetical protein